jgi:hypothetical protein
MEKLNYRTLVLLAFMVIIISIRVIAPLSPDFKVIANFSGVGAVFLFGGAYFKNRWTAFLLPILVLFVSDLGLVLTMGKSYGFYEGWYYTYAPLILIALIARLVIANRINIKNVLGASLIGVFIHWIVSDYGVWLGSTVYPQTFAGFCACLVAAIPYELNFLYGTVAYSAIMFAAFEGLKLRFPTLRLARVK